MQKEFLALYHDELQSFRQRAAIFSRTYPEAAAQLRLTDDLADDPHVERLIESFAFIAARIRHKLEDSFPELSAGLIEALYPHLLAPRPAMSIVHLQPSADLTTIQRVPRGFELLSNDIEGDKCRFRTTQPVDLTPAKIVNIAYETDSETLSFSPFKTTQSALILSLASLKRDGNLGVAGLKSIRLHLSGAWEQASQLYMHILANAVGLSLSCAKDTTKRLFLSADHIKPAGFHDEESLLPQSAHFHSGLRLLREFFDLRRKFLFLDISGLENWASKTLTITIYLNQQDHALRRSLNADSITLNATPAINLFRQRCEPVHLTGKREQYPIVPDYRFRHSRKFHSVEHVSAINDNKLTVPCHAGAPGKPSHPDHDLVWQIVRNPAASEDADCKISFHDKGLTHDKPLIIRIDALCTNAKLPNRLLFNGGQLQLLPAAPQSMIAAIRCLMPFTLHIAQPLSGDQLWQLISHLRINHLSISDDKGKVLREILHLYKADDDAAGKKFIESIQSVTPRSSTYRVAGGGFAAATDFEIRFSQDSLLPAEIFLFASVLNQFLQLYTAVNSFSRVTAWIENQTQPVVSFPFSSSIRRPV